jgi:hypothetical protein
MTSKVKAKSNGVVSPQGLKLSVENSLGAWLAHMEAQAEVLTALKSNDPILLLAAIRGVVRTVWRGDARRDTSR